MKRVIENDLEQWRIESPRKPLVLVGARQVGKTYILKTWGTAKFRKVHVFNFEKSPALHSLFDGDLSANRLINDLSISINAEISIQSDLIFFDEIQACPKALTSLKYFSEEMPSAFVCAAGSLLGVTLNEAPFPVGKINLLRMTPLSFEEFLEATNQKILLKAFREATIENPPSTTAHEKLWNFWKTYTIVGGMPEAVTIFIRENSQSTASIFKKIRKLQETLIQNYEADMAKHSGRINALHLRRIWRSVPEQLARNMDGSAGRYRFKDVVAGMNKYSRLASGIDWLQSAGLIIRIPIAESGRRPLAASTKESFFKLYLFDIGLLGFLCGLSPEDLKNTSYGSYKGYVAENFVAQEFFHHHWPVFCWNEKESEVEFLVERTGVFPIEVKSGHVTKAKSLAVFAEKYKPAFRTIISAKPMRFNEERKILYLPLYLASRWPTGFVGEEG